MREGGAVSGGRFTARPGIRRGLIGLFLLAVGLIGPPPLEAQLMAGQESTEGGFDLFLFAGAFQPLANLTEDPSSFGTVLSPDVVVGAEATVWVSRSFGIGVIGAFSPPDLSPVPTQFQGAVPENLGSADYLAGLLQVSYRIRSSGSAGSLEPYFSLGGGVRRISVDAIAEPEVETTTDPAAALAAGIRVLVTSGIWFKAELRDIASYYESPTTGDSSLQNDIVISLGFGKRFP